MAELLSGQWGLHNYEGVSPMQGNRCFVALRTNGAEPVFKSGILALEQTVSSFEDFLKLALVGEHQLLSGFRET